MLFSSTALKQNQEKQTMEEDEEEKKQSTKATATICEWQSNNKIAIVDRRYYAYVSQEICI